MSVRSTKASLTSAGGRALPRRAWRLDLACLGALFVLFLGPTGARAAPDPALLLDEAEARVAEARFVEARSRVRAALSVLAPEQRELFIRALRVSALLAYAQRDDAQTSVAIDQLVALRAPLDARRYPRALVALYAQRVSTVPELSVRLVERAGTGARHLVAELPAGASAAMQTELRVFVHERAGWQSFASRLVQVEPDGVVRAYAQLVEPQTGVVLASAGSAVQPLSFAPSPRLEEALLPRGAPVQDAAVATPAGRWPWVALTVGGVLAASAAAIFLWPREKAGDETFVLVGPMGMRTGEEGRGLQ